MSERMRLKVAANAARQATIARYTGLPPLPDLRSLTTWLRNVNSHCDGPGRFYLQCNTSLPTGEAWFIGLEPGALPHVDHPEELPGDGKRFDAVAAARRMLAEGRSSGFR